MTSTACHHRKPVQLLVANDHLSSDQNPSYDSIESWLVDRNPYNLYIMAIINLV